MGQAHFLAFKKQYAQYVLHDLVIMTSRDRTQPISLIDLRHDNVIIMPSNYVQSISRT